MRLWRQAAIGAAFLLASACISEADGAVKTLGPGHLYVTWKGWSRIRSPRPGSSRDSWTGKPSSALSRKGLDQEGIPFDTPFSSLPGRIAVRRLSILDAVKAEDQVLREVGLIIRDIEVNAWGRRRPTRPWEWIRSFGAWSARVRPKWSVSRRGSSFWTVSTRG